ncbi:MAG: hypothetical protein ACK5NB_06295 [Flavobacteriaceae bacterium]
MKNNIDNLFNQLNGCFDVEEPTPRHQQRFLEKLNKANRKSVPKWHRFIKPTLGIAASAIVILAVFIGLNTEPKIKDLANVSPEMAQTQDFFNNSINEELKKLEKASVPETKKVIQDALNQIKILEKNYEILKTDLTESGDDNRVIHAMISNFQNRINILQNALAQIEIIKQLNQQSYDVNNTI